ncbi:MAG: c-type cytochrome domain-containing protein [Pirellulales bacterium]
MSRTVLTLHSLPLISAACCCLLAASAWAEDAEIKPIEIAKVERDAPVDFGRDIAPILSAKCLACHSASSAEGDLVLESPASLLKGGGNGPAAVPSKSAESLVLKLAAHQAEPLMPPPDNDVGAAPLSPQELGLLALWIDQGAREGSAGAAAETIAWQNLPAHVRPILSVALSPDGQYVACSRGNQVYVYHLGTGQQAARLVDPSLAAAGHATPEGAADVDLVQALAFAPNGRTLATGGYRTVRLWRREAGAAPAKLAEAPAKPVALAVSPTGDRAAFAGEREGQPVVQIVKLPEGSTVSALAGHTGELTGVQFARDGQSVFTASRDGSLRAWSGADGALLAKLDAKTPLTALALVADGKQLAAAGADGKLRLWNVPEKLADLATAEARELAGPGPVNALCAVGAGQLLAGGTDGAGILYDLGSGQPVRQWKHQGPINAVAARGDGARLATATAAGVRSFGPPIATSPSPNSRATASCPAAPRLPSGSRMRSPARPIAARPPPNKRPRT